jgi:hypothetical protein
LPRRRVICSILRTIASREYLEMTPSSRFLVVLPERFWEAVLLETTAVNKLKRS